MTVYEHSGADLRPWSGNRRLLATLALGVGLAAAATGHGVASAATGDGDTSGASSSASGPSTAGPKTTAAGKGRHRHAKPATPADAGDADAPATQPKSTASQTDSAATAPQPASHTPKHQKTPQTSAATKPATGTTAHPSIAKAATTAATAAPLVAAAAVTNATTPTPPGPLSPIAKIFALPGRLVNTVLQALDLTAAVGGPKSPLNFAPIDEALFAAFRGVEGALGLRRTPTGQPALATETYTGPTTAATPTVTQFLNAAAAGYVLGGTPGGMVPFTVDGVPLTSTNLFSGESAQVWVTPQQQIIIAYQGTTGGTNLLFKPLIAISQILTDAQIILTDTTPQAFTDALSFEQKVQAAAAAQGYDSSDVFLTGHSLGGWEAEYVAQQTGLDGVGFESPGINTVLPGNGAGSGFVNVETYGDTAAFSATDLPALQPFIPAYVPGGGSKPHYGDIVMIGDPTATYPLVNASALVGPNLLGDAIFAVDVFGNFFEHHLPGMQAYNLGVSSDPGVVPWLGATMGPIDAGYADLTITQLLLAASQAGTLITP